MSPPHSPLPPEPPVSLESLDIKLSRLIAAHEAGMRISQGFDDRIVRVEKIAQRMTAAALAMSAARVTAAVVPPVRSLAIMGIGSFLGGFAATILWQWWHAASALAFP